jgi:hypothetical protein
MFSLIDTMGFTATLTRRVEEPGRDERMPASQLPREEVSTS